MSYLVRWYDPALQPREGDTRASITREERERLTRLFYVAMGAAAIPRRLGAGVGSDELGRDKVRSKRIAHVAHQCALAWGGLTRKTNDTERDSAQVQWSVWWGEQQVYLSNRLVYIVTWQTKLNKDERWAKTAVTRLENERRWLQYAMR